ncbi:MAG: M48 family metalloprotease [Polyangiaceae bacterium]|nr:M48 family metalloprotease [Polyangiaceae bacterium]
MRRTAAALLLCASACASPTVAPRPPRAPDPEQVGGEIVADLLMGAHGPVRDPALEKYVSAVGARVARTSGGRERWRFRVTDDPTPGAHALPGGVVLVARGALIQLDSEAELAAVLAHEIAHTVMGHTRLAKTRLPAHATEGPTRSAALDADEERQADALAVRYVQRAGYRPAAVGSALAALSRGVIHQCRAEGVRPDCATARDPDDPHPAMPARLARVALLAGTAEGEVARERYLRQIEGLAVGGASATLESGRFRSAGGLSFAIPPGFSPTLSGNMLTAKALDAELVILRLSGRFLREATQSALRSAPYVARELGGRRALIGSLGSDDAQRIAIVAEGEALHVIAVSGPSRELYLDRVLESTRPDERRPTSRLVIVRARTRMRVSELVRQRCPETTPALAEALNGLGASAMVERGHALKCAGK